jgi:uncharacterized protein YbjT (DUF2867 family)
MCSPVHVLGASGRSGLALCRALLATGRTVTPVVRDGEKWRRCGLGLRPRIADLTDPVALERALAGAVHIVSCAHARHTKMILQAAPAATRFVLLGSTRRFTRWPDAHGRDVLAGEKAFLASGRPGVMLHPTMIYGAEGENNVQRLVTLLRRLPLVPLPAGGRALVQPIHQDDVTRCLLAALSVAWDGPHTIVIAGPTAVSYADFVRAVAAAAGLPPPRLLSLPAWLLRAAAPLTILPGLPRVQGAEIRRLLEDKKFSVADMIAKLGIHPISLSDGLARTFRS